MIETSIIITMIVCSSALLGYVTRLFFYSKCSDVSMCCFKCHRNTNEESQTVSNMNLPIKI
jgi:hypothetical protein